MVEQKQPSPVSERPIGFEESLARNLIEITTPKDETIDFHSEFDDEEILSLAALKTWAKATGFEIINDFCTFFERLRVSRFRQGRREVALTVGLAGGGGGIARAPKSFRDLLTSLRV
jgi:hypothetical protein